MTAISWCLAWDAGIELAILQRMRQALSVEAMVFRALYHFSRARQQERADALVPFLVQFHKSFGLVKA